MANKTIAFELRILPSEGEAKNSAFIYSTKQGTHAVSTAQVTRKAAVTKTELSALGELTGLGMEGGQALK